MSFSLDSILISDEVGVSSSEFTSSTFSTIPLSFCTKLTLVSLMLPRLLLVGASSTLDSFSAGLW